MIRSKYNIDFLPEDFQKYILKKIQSEGISFRISSPRKSKLGDYKYIYFKKIHAISVNIDLSEIQFLITFIHELAHKKCYDIYAGRVSAHGKEWKGTERITMEGNGTARNRTRPKTGWDLDKAEQN